MDPIHDSLVLTQFYNWNKWTWFPVPMNEVHKDWIIFGTLWETVISWVTLKSSLHNLSLHFNILLKFLYGVFVLWSPSFLRNSDQLNLLYISKSISSQEADIYFVGSNPTVQFANYFMSPGNYEKQSHRCQSASSWAHFTIKLNKIKRPTTLHFGYTAWFLM